MAEKPVYYIRVENNYLKFRAAHKTFGSLFSFWSCIVFLATFSALQ